MINAHREYFRLRQKSEVRATQARVVIGSSTQRVDDKRATSVAENEPDWSLPREMALATVARADTRARIAEDRAQPVASLGEANGREVVRELGREWATRPDLTARWVSRALGLFMACGDFLTLRLLGRTEIFGEHLRWQ
jgi:hypothetical protein